MSAKLMGQVWDLDIPHGEAWVLLALADHADHEGRNAYPGVELLAYKTNYSVRQVQRILASLEEKQIIKPVANEKGGRSARTVYEIHLENGDKKAPFRSIERVTKSHRISSEKGDISDTKRVTFQAEKGDISDTLYKEEPSLTVRRTVMPAANDCFDDLSEKMSEIESAVIEACKYECFDARSEKKLLETVATLSSAGFSPNDIREFSKTRRKVPAIQYLVSDLSSWRASQPPPSPAPKVYCGSCKSGWIPPGPGEDRARRCSCNRPSPAPVREVSV